MLTEAQKTQVRTFFSQMDNNGSGVLTKEDFEIGAKRIAEKGNYSLDSSEYKAIHSQLMEEWNSIKSSADVDDNGEVTFDEVVNWIDRVILTQPAEFERLMKETNRRIFDVLDADNDGSISYEEFKKIDYGLLESQLKQFFESIDSDKNGSISREEYAETADWFTTKLG